MIAKIYHAENFCKSMTSYRRENVEWKSHLHFYQYKLISQYIALSGLIEIM